LAPTRGWGQGKPAGQGVGVNDYSLTPEPVERDALHLQHPRLLQRQGLGSEKNRMAFSKQVTMFMFYTPSQKTTGLYVDEWANDRHASARCRPEAEADVSRQRRGNHIVAGSEDGYFCETTGLVVGLNHTWHQPNR
jgi:hypothetical protein